MNAVQGKKRNTDNGADASLLRAEMGEQRALQSVHLWTLMGGPDMFKESY